MTTKIKATVPQTPAQEINSILISLDSLPKTEAGGFDWNLIRAAHASKWARLMELSKGRKQRIWQALHYLREQGRVAAAPTKPADKKGRAKPAPAAPHAGPAMHYCPQCAFPIGALIKAVNAMNTLPKA